MPYIQNNITGILILLNFHSNFYKVVKNKNGNYTLFKR